MKLTLLLLLIGALLLPVSPRSRQSPSEEADTLRIKMPLCFSSDEFFCSISQKNGNFHFKAPAKMIDLFGTADLKKTENAFFASAVTGAYTLLVAFDHRSDVATISLTIHSSGDVSQFTAFDPRFHFVCFDR